MPNVFAAPHPFPERCAAEWGQDVDYGVFMGFGVGPVKQRVVQRMRWIAPGSFVMGSPENEIGRDDDEAQHRVELTQGYWLADTPVTQALWEAVMETNPSHFKDPKCPVEFVTWDDCQRFITRLNELVPGLDARLPTEAEWEYACRAGTTTATWVGDLQKGQEIRARLLDPVAWYYGNADGKTHPVAQKQANPWGLYDMLGNVYEWCADWHAPYDATTLYDPHGPAMGVRRVIRGGSWLGDARGVRAALRFALVPGFRDDSLGFRLARGPAPSQGSGATNTRGAPRRAESPRQGGAGRGTTP